VYDWDDDNSFVNAKNDFIAEKKRQRKTRRLDLRININRSLEPMSIRQTDVNFINPSPTLGLASVRSQWALKDRMHRLYEVEQAAENHYLSDSPIDYYMDKLGQKRIYQGNEGPFYDFSSSSSDRMGRADRKKVISEFIRHVYHTGIICVNTDAHRQGQKHREDIMISFANLRGEVIFYNRTRAMPEPFFAVLKDVGITKVGVGFSSDLRELTDVGVDVLNWADIGCARLAFHSGALQEKREHPDTMIKYSVETLIWDLVKQKLFSDQYVRTPYNAHSHKVRKLLDQSILPKEMIPHVKENVKVPLAYLVFIADHYALCRGYDTSSEPILPIMHEALDLIRGRDPLHLQHHIDGNIDLWLGLAEVLDRNQAMLVPSSALGVNNYRRALANHGENYFDRETIAKHTTTALKLYTGDEALDIPFANELENRHAFGPQSDRCRTCAGRGHPTEKCGRKFVACDYEHFGETLPAHTILTCPMLHSYCDTCLTVGHPYQVHFYAPQMRPSLELRRLYFTHMSRGAWTCLPFLSLDPEMAKKMNTRHWLYSFDGARFRHANITRYALKITSKSIIFGELSDEERTLQYNVYLEEELRRREAYGIRINAKNILDCQPLERHGIRLETIAQIQAKRQRILVEKELRATKQKSGKVSALSRLGPKPTSRR
jgi:hypothetical protein